jgi:hypothetical protein
MNPSGSALEFRIVGGLTDEQEAHCPDFSDLHFQPLNQSTRSSRVLAGLALTQWQFLQFLDPGIAGIALLASIDKNLLKVQERLSI